MSRLGAALAAIHELDELAAGDGYFNRLQPLAKLLATLCYLVVLLSFNTYALTGVLLMGIYPLLVLQAANISLCRTIKRFAPAAFLLLGLGLANLYYDTSTVLRVGAVAVSGGWLALCVLLLKGLWSFLAVYFLIATTGMEQICYALQQVKVPRILVVVLLLTYRYLILLLQEAGNISAAYALRAPAAKGIGWRDWGALLGQLLLRSLDQAQQVYESMLLRGFNGSFYLHHRTGGVAAAYLFTVVVLFFCLAVRLL